MRRGSARQPALSTRDRILHAAILRFSSHSYEETGLRDIAADVGVDVAYVHRCFGSKERLFAEALAATLRPDRLLANATGDLAGNLAKEVFAHDGARARGEVVPLDIVIRSLSSPEASRVLRDFVQNDFIDVLARKLHQPATGRVALIAAFLAGVSILRNVLRIDPLLEAEGGELEGLIAHAIDGLMRPDIVAERA
jgi:AcrR family transcriptional regulator